jgi:CRISPR/Cas system-associated exonuclease Cas4 (RecB family)
MTNNDLPIKHLSFSSLSLFGNCPASWKGKYVDKRREPMSEAAMFGTRFEEAVAQRLGFRVTEYQEEGEKDEVAVEKVLDQVHYDNADIYLRHNRAWTSADGYQTKITIDPDKFEHLARHYGLSLSIFLPYIGYIDFDREDGILDLKTSARKGWKETWGLQIVSYLLSEGKASGDIHLLTRTKIPKTYFYNVFLTDAFARSTLRWIAHQAKGVQHMLESGEEPGAQIGWLCGYCASSSVCEAREFCDIPALD